MNPILFWVAPRNNVAVQHVRAHPLQRMRHEHARHRLKQRAFFSRQLLGIAEVACMRIAEMRQHAFRWGDALAQASHFSWLGNPRLNQGHVVVGVQRPNAQRYAQLAVVAQRAPMHGGGFGQQPSNPLLDGGFSVASSDGQHGPLKGVALSACETLQSQQDIVNHENVRVVRPWFRVAATAHHKPTHARASRFGEKVVTIVPRPFQGKENGVFRVLKGSGVGRQSLHDARVGTMRNEAPRVVLDVLDAPLAPSLDAPPPSRHADFSSFAAT